MADEQIECGLCDLENGATVIKCKRCDKTFHLSCAGVSNGQDYVCKSCFPGLEMKSQGAIKKHVIATNNNKDQPRSKASSVRSNSSSGSQMKLLNATLSAMKEEEEAIKRRIEFMSKFLVDDQIKRMEITTRSEIADPIPIQNWLEQTEGIRKANSIEFNQRENDNNRTRSVAIDPIEQCTMGMRHQYKPGTRKLPELPKL